MKNFLLALLLLAPLTASASVQVSCESMANVAKEAAEARESGLPLEAALSVTTGDGEIEELIRTTVRMAYNIRLLSPEGIKEVYLANCNK